MKPPRLALLAVVVRGITILNPPVAAAIGVPYAHTFRLFGGTPPYTMEMLTVLPPGWSYDAATKTLSNPMPDTAGSFSITVYALDASGERQLEQTFMVTVSALPLTITNALPDYTAGVVQSFDFATSGGVSGPKTYALTSGALPPGLTLSIAGHVSGNTTGLAVGTHTYTYGVTAFDASSSASAEIVRTVTVTVVPMSITNSAPAATAGSAYTFAYAKSGGTGAVTWSKPSGTLPPGISLSPAGVLTGTPSAGGNYAYIVASTDAAMTVATRSESITVLYPALSLSGLFAAGEVAAAYNRSIAIAGGNGAYSLHGGTGITAGALPPGLTLSISGNNLILSGTPTAEGSYTFTVTVDSGDGQSASSMQVMTVIALKWDAAQITSYASLTNGNLDVVANSGSWGAVLSTLGKSSGKWYVEIYHPTAYDLGSAAAGFGIGLPDTYPGHDSKCYAHLSDGYKANNGYTAYGVAWDDVNNTLCMAIDIDAGKIWFGKNGVWMTGDPATGASPAFTGLPSGTYYVVGGVKNSRNWIRIRQTPTYSVPAGFTYL